MDASLQCSEFRPPTWRELLFSKAEPVDTSLVLVQIGGEGRVVPRSELRRLVASEEAARARADLALLASSGTAALAYLGANSVGKSPEERRRAMLVGAQVESLVVSVRGPALGRAMGMQRAPSPTVTLRRAAQVQRPPGEAPATRGVPAEGTQGPATRFVYPKTGQSVVTDNATGEISHVGGPGCRHE